MPSTPIHQDDRGYLSEARRQVLHTSDGLDDYQIRHPMTSMLEVIADQFHR